MAARLARRQSVGGRRNTHCQRMPPTGERQLPSRRASPNRGCLTRIRPSHAVRIESRMFSIGTPLRVDADHRVIVCAKEYRFLSRLLDGPIRRARAQGVANIVPHFPVTTSPELLYQQPRHAVIKMIVWIYGNTGIRSVQGD